MPKAPTTTTTGANHAKTPYTISTDHIFDAATQSITMEIRTVVKDDGLVSIYRQLAAIES